MKSVSNIISSINLVELSHALILIIAGFIIAKIISKLGTNILARRYNINATKVRSGIFYVIFIIFIFMALQHLGFHLNLLLGAAGILTVALGFASQTSVSNIISGLFLITEKSFVINDCIRIDTITGKVISIDLLSIKLLTSENTMVRIPNESIIKTTVINLTRFPIHRFDLAIGIAYKENIPKVREILLALAEKNPLCLEEPRPEVCILGFGDSAINLQFSVWATKENFSQLKNLIQEEVKTEFDHHNIEMPFRQLGISTSSTTIPFPIKIIS